MFWKLNMFWPEIKNIRSSYAPDTQERSIFTMEAKIYETERKKNTIKYVKAHQKAIFITEKNTFCRSLCYLYCNVMWAVCIPLCRFVFEVGGFCTVASWWLANWLVCDCLLKIICLLRAPPKFETPPVLCDWTSIWLVFQWVKTQIQLEFCKRKQKHAKLLIWVSCRFGFGFQCFISASSHNLCICSFCFTHPVLSVPFEVFVCLFFRPLCHLRN